MIELHMEQEKEEVLGAKLRVLGVGGSGGNAVNSMIESAELEEVEFIVANTDAQALSNSPAGQKLQLGKKVTKGLGAGSNPDVGRRAAEEDIEEIKACVAGTDILFLTAGLGGGTGSGALPVIADVAREMGILTVAIVTKPFSFEGRRRLRVSQQAIESLKKSVDTFIVVPNQKLLELVEPTISMLDAFALSNSILLQAIKGISDIITRSGHINVDFADVRSVMKDMGMALMGTGCAEGEGRAEAAAKKAISSQLLEQVDIHGAQGVLINITGNSDLGLHEINQAASVVYDMVSEDANIILGSVIDSTMENKIKVTVIATGFGDQIGAQKPIDKIMQPKHTTENKVVAAVKEEPVVAELAQPSVVAQEPVVLSPAATHQPIVTPQRRQQDPLEESFDMNSLDTPAYIRKKAQK